MDRNANGTFANGNAGGPGRPPRQTEREYLRATLDGCSLDDWAAIVSRAVADAKAGDATVRAWLGRYLVGTPAHDAIRPHRLEKERLTDADPLSEEIERDQQWAEADAELARDDPDSAAASDKLLARSFGMLE